jgi:hypothetical protein
MSKKSAFLNRLARHQSTVELMLDQFSSMSDELLNRRKADGSWSVMQNIHHLILAEELALKYVEKKMEHTTQLADFAPVGFKTWYCSTLLNAYMRFGGKVKAPKIVSTEALPEYSTIAEARQRWKQSLDAWHGFISALPDDGMQRAIYKHPAAGRLSFHGMLDFFKLHQQRHLKQMKRALLSIVICCFGLAATAQNETPLGCGTQPEIGDWLEQYLQNPTIYRSGADTVLFTRMQLHLLAKDDGVGRFRTGSLLDALCRLNTDFVPAKIQFFYDKPWNLINNTAWYDHNDLTTGIQMMLQNKVDSSINSYFVTDPAGNCGYNLPYGGVAMSHSCSGVNAHTWAHEVGHNLRLPHPFIGWEGKTYNYNTPTPLTLTYDYTNFHDTLDIGPTVDTAFVEYLNGSNCQNSADKLCLTKPDYLAYRWPCDNMNMSTVKQKDPNGQDFYSDGSLFMSYSFDNCQSRFSDDQIQVMRASLLSEKITYVKQDYVAQTISSLPAPVMPIGGQMVSADAVTMHWTRTPGATQYLVQGNRISASFPIIEFEFVVPDTFVTALNLVANKTWHYRIRPFNPSYFCTTFSTVGSFFTLPPTAVIEPQTKDWYLYPNLLDKSQEAFLSMPDNEHFEGNCTLTDLNGRVVAQLRGVKLTNHSTVPIDLKNIPIGMYFLHLQQGDKQKALKVIIQ